jgi:hypothetical protein
MAAAGADSLQVMASGFAKLMGKTEAPMTQVAMAALFWTPILLLLPWVNLYDPML